jgi:hypothetical protein
LRSSSGSGSTRARCSGSWPAGTAPKAPADPAGPGREQPAADLAAAYELARSAALDGRAGGHGVAVIRARGVAAWMQACDGLPATPVPAPLAAHGVPAPAGPVVTVLAAMTLAAMTAGTATLKERQ